MADRVRHARFERIAFTTLGDGSWTPASYSADPIGTSATRLTRELGLRFVIDIHPVGDVPSPRDDNAVVDRIETDGVELLVFAG